MYVYNDCYTEIQTLTFSSEAEFYTWKEKEEQETFTHYVKTTGQLDSDASTSTTGQT